MQAGVHFSRVNIWDFLPRQLTFRLDPQLCSGLDAAGLIGCDTLVDPGVGANQAKDLQGCATDHLGGKRIGIFNYIGICILQPESIRSG